jgi:hypothetical protein
MKKSLIVLTLLSTLLFPTFLLYGAGEEILPEENEAVAQELTELEEDSVERIIDDSTKISQNVYFDLRLERKPQTPFGNYVPYVLTVTPHLNSPRTQIIWNTPSTLESKPKHQDFVSLQEGQEYIFEGRIRPLRGGTYDFSISVISWQHDTNYTNSINDTIVFSENLVLQPVTSQYQLLNVLKFGLIAVAFIVVVILVLFLVRGVAPKAKDWLTPPDWK